MTAQESINRDLLNKLDKALVDFKLNPSEFNKMVLQKAMDNYQEFHSLIK